MCHAGRKPRCHQAAAAVAKQLHLPAERGLCSPEILECQHHLSGSSPAPSLNQSLTAEKTACMSSTTKRMTCNGMAAPSALPAEGAAVSISTGSAGEVSMPACRLTAQHIHSRPSTAPAAPRITHPGPTKPRPFDLRPNARQMPGARQGGNQQACQQGEHRGAQGSCPG